MHSAWASEQTVHEQTPIFVPSRRLNNHSHDFASKWLWYDNWRMNDILAQAWGDPTSFTLHLPPHIIGLDLTPESKSWMLSFILFIVQGYFKIIVQGFDLVPIIFPSTGTRTNREHVFDQQPLSSVQWRGIHKSAAASHPDPDDPILYSKAKIRVPKFRQFTLDVIFNLKQCKEILFQIMLP